MQNQDSTSNDNLHFPNQANFLSAISANKDSQPTKNKVAAFKARVLKLVLLYAEKSNNLGPLLKSINQQMFLKQPEKLHTIIIKALNRPNIDDATLLELLNMYKILLLFKNKSKNKNDIFTEVFVKILKRVYGTGGEDVIRQMIETVILKRSCILNINFFFFLTRKLPQTRSLILKKCTQIESNHKIRPAQQKQLQKLQSKLGKKFPKVKREENPQTE